jgi:ABC-type transport system involved in multi-copper enzyme maturation permease subunit
VIAHRRVETTGDKAARRDWSAISALVEKDLRAVRRSKAVAIPMIAVPGVLLVLLPLVLVIVTSRAGGGDVERFLGALPDGVAEPITSLPQHEQLIVLVNGFLLAPLFLIVPLMVSAVLAADTFAGEKERRTLETVLHLPVRDADLYLAKLLSAFAPAVAVAWVCFVLYAIVSNAVAWPVMHRVYVPTAQWLALIFWVAPGVAALGLGIMVRVSARAQTAQGANQLGGAVIFPLVFLALGQSTVLLATDTKVALVTGAVIWCVALLLAGRGARRFTRDGLATSV